MRMNFSNKEVEIYRREFGDAIAKVRSKLSGKKIKSSNLELVLKGVRGFDRKTTS